MSDQDNGKAVEISWIKKELDETKEDMRRQFDLYRNDMIKGFDEIKNEIKIMNMNSNSAREVRNKEVDIRISTIEKRQNLIENKVYYLLGGIAVLYAAFNLFKEPLAKLLGV